MPSALKGYSFEKRRVLSMTSYQGGPRGVSKNRPCHTRIYPWLTYLLTWIIHRFSRDLFRPPETTRWNGVCMRMRRTKQRSVTAAKRDVVHDADCSSEQDRRHPVFTSTATVRQVRSDARSTTIHSAWRSAVLHPLLRVQLRQRLCRMWISHCYRQQGISRRVSRLITGGGRFLQILDLFGVWKLVFSWAVYGKPLFLK